MRNTARVSRPCTLCLEHWGHEIAGVVENCGRDVTRLHRGDRVCVHYRATCGDCEYCNRGYEQFCASGKMIGKHRDGGYAEYVCVPALRAQLQLSGVVTQTVPLDAEEINGVLDSL